jgi:hypothetical protein
MSAMRFPYVMTAALLAEDVELPEMRDGAVHGRADVVLARDVAVK